MKIKDVTLEQFETEMGDMVDAGVEVNFELEYCPHVLAQMERDTPDAEYDPVKIATCTKDDDGYECENCSDLFYGHEKMSTLEGFQDCCKECGNELINDSPEKFSWS